jgi:carbamoyl-phosphate synthase large subunit
MAIGRNLEESLQKAIRSLETGIKHLGLKTKQAQALLKKSKEESEFVMTKDYSSSEML